MQAETIKSYLSGRSRADCLEFWIAGQCAPVLKGIKMANMIAVPRGACGWVRQRLKGSKVICILLFMGREKDILLLYRRPMLEVQLRRREVQRFLGRLGYRNFDTASVIIRLRSRYNSCIFRRGGSFPHEMGVILGYPVEDVEAFIRFGGKNYLAAGYWKVYHNRKAAEEMFRRFDEVRELAMTEMMKGFTLREVAGED